MIAAGIGPSWDLLVDYPLTDFRDYQTLPFPLSYDGPLNTGSPGGFLNDSAEPLLLYYLPLALVLGLAGRGRRAGPAAARAARDRDRACFALGALAYLLVRTDLFHTAPLAVMVAILAAWALADRSGAPRRARPRWRGSRSSSRSPRGSTAAGSCCARTPSRSTCRSPTACACRRSRRPSSRRSCAGCLPRGPIYVATRRSDLVTSGHPLLYVLADRENPTRYDIPAPGVVTSAPVQREIVRDLERTRTPMVVRWTDPVTAAAEPNAAGRSSGVRLLDEYLARSYREAEREGSFRLLERRAP